MSKKAQTISLFITIIIGNSLFAADPLGQIGRARSNSHIERPRTPEARKVDKMLDKKKTREAQLQRREETKNQIAVELELDSEDNKRVRREKSDGSLKKPPVPSLLLGCAKDMNDVRVSPVEVTPREITTPRSRKLSDIAEEPDSEIALSMLKNIKRDISELKKSFSPRSVLIDLETKMAGLSLAVSQTQSHLIALEQQCKELLSDHEKQTRLNMLLVQMVNKNASDEEKLELSTILKKLSKNDSSTDDAS